MNSEQLDSPMDRVLVLHEDAFYDFFRPYRHPQVHQDIWGGLGLEAFGADFEVVKSLPPSKMWTVMDGDHDQWIVPGIHTVNRICFLVTEIAHDWSDVEFRIPRRGYSLTKLGLLRQVNKLRKLKGTKRLSF